ncbi:poly(A) polymerase [Candidatus Tisiphia endosymbiont of Beris chalybata]|uniref:poly(A) polymerase n=1 Tax=Candidatus Tisiphia endosymbiont of Beris chalybata TaxID=3066262 RepID=UPI00397754B1
MHISCKQLIIPSNYYQQILSILQQGGGRARVVGGAVRDAILNRKNYDIDIATNLLPQQTIEILGKANIKVLPTGEKYGTVTAFFNKEKFEITTLRKDVQTDGRHASVIFTDDFFQDAARRDFTINALSYCPFEHKIYDYFNGLQDLQESRVIFIGQAHKRIQEDYLRILRFFRFSCYYAKQLDRDGLNACVELKTNLHTLSKERIKWEMDKLVMSANSPHILQQMFNSRILQLIFPITKFDHKILLKTILLSDDFAARLDGAKPIDNRRALSNDACKFISKEYINLSKEMGPLQLYHIYSLLFEHIHNLQVSDLLDLKFSRQEASKIISMIRFIRALSKLATTKEFLGEAKSSRAAYIDDCYGTERSSTTKLSVGVEFGKSSINSVPLVVDTNILKKIWIEENDYLQRLNILVALGRLEMEVAQEFIKDYSLRQRPIFPLNGHDLHMQNIHGKVTGKFIRILKELWIESDFMLTKEQLLNMLADKYESDY